MPDPTQAAVPSVPTVPEVQSAAPAAAEVRAADADVEDLVAAVEAKAKTAVDRLRSFLLEGKDLIKSAFAEVTQAAHSALGHKPQ